MADKHGRVQAIIQKNLADIILYELKNPLTKFVSVNAVRITSDYSYGKVYVSDINPEKTDEIVAFLNNNAKKIRSMLAAKLDIYKTPELKFFADKSFEEQQAMNELVERAINAKPVTLKDVFGEDYHMVDEEGKKE
jgi:ribosome-binding factor A